MEILKNFSLKNYNTFGIDATADYAVKIDNKSIFKKLSDYFAFKESKKLVLGGGSNILFTGKFEGIVIIVELGGIDIIEETNEYAVVEAGAGVKWHDLVTYCVNNGFYGIENLALIPGTVGAAVVQNIGAYGMEQKSCFESCSIYHLNENSFSSLNNEQCNFGYRYSIFKNNLKDKALILSAQYKLKKDWYPNLSYKELKTEIHNTFPNGGAELPDVFEAVCNIRRRKLPDPAIIGNAGSFFKNSIVNTENFNELKTKFPDIPSYNQTDGSVKIPAAWLIEQAGWKGYRKGDAGVYEKHSLVLVNHGNATGMDILNLSKEIQNSVNDKFGIMLEREVLVV